MGVVFAKFLFAVALMLAAYFFICSAISYAIDYYFKVKNKQVDNVTSDDIEEEE